MKISFEPKEPVTDAACKKATGKTLAEWFKQLDNGGYLEKGRRESVSFLYEQCNKNIWWSVTIAVEFEKSKNIKKKDGRYEGYGICATKTIAAPVEKIYKALTDPKAMSAWLGPKVVATPKDGGKFTCGDGESGEYLRCRENKDLRFTWNHKNATAPTLVDVIFQEKGEKTTVMFNHSRIQTRAEADGLHAGWGAALDRLKGMLEKS
ncbi:MAG: SRPBCC domain-containing protein [Planctomycetes bacterium]|nr:SRPBCC domain-containing protein [Planctomycetota bacterium]